MSPDAVTKVILIPGHTDTSRGLSIKLRHVRHQFPILVGLHPCHGRNPRLGTWDFPKMKQTYHQGSHPLRVRLWIYLHSAGEIYGFAKLCLQFQGFKDQNAHSWTVWGCPCTRNKSPLFYFIEVIIKIKSFNTYRCVTLQNYQNLASPRYHECSGEHPSRFLDI